MDRQKMNMEAIQARKKAKDYRSRKGGISDKALKGLNKKEKKEWKDAGYISNTAVGFAANKYERDKYNDKRKMFEEAAYEHGYGNIETADQARDFMKGFKEAGTNLNSYSDVRQFRRAHNDFDSKRFDEIEGKLNKQGSAPKPQAKPEQPKKEEGPVTDSPEFAKAKETVAARDDSHINRGSIWGSGSSKPTTTDSPPSNKAGGFGESFMHRYKQGVKDNQEPTKPTGGDGKVYAGGSPGWYSPGGPGDGGSTPGAPTNVSPGANWTKTNFKDPNQTYRPRGNW